MLTQDILKCNSCKWKCNNELMNGNYCWCFRLGLKEAWDKCNGTAYHNLKGMSNQKELDINRKEINDHAFNRLADLLKKIIKNKKYTKNELKRLISLAKWTLEEKRNDSFGGKYNKEI